jgi:WD40 repeat protein
VLRPTYFEAINEMEKKKDMEVLMNGIRSHVSAVACHPTKPLVAFAIGEGYLQIWDYNKKEDYFNDFTQADISTRIKEAGGEEKKAGKNEKKKYQFYSCITFTKDGSELLIGRSDGVIKVFDPIGNEMKNLSGELKASESENAKRNDAIKHIVVSDCGKYFATSDTHNCVCLFKKEHYMGVEDNPIEWGFAGKIRSHTDAITGLAFGEEEDENDKL